MVSNNQLALNQFLKEPVKESSMFKPDESFNEAFKEIFGSIPLVSNNRVKEIK